MHGDADYIGNWMGGEAVSLTANYSQSVFFRGTSYKPLVFGGEEHGKVREYGNLSFVVVHEAGHFVPAEKPDVALEIFRRAIEGRDIAEGRTNVGDQAAIPFPADTPLPTSVSSLTLETSTRRVFIET